MFKMLDRHGTAVFTGAMFLVVALGLWWYNGVSECEDRGGVAVRQAIGFTIVCIDKSALK